MAQTSYRAPGVYVEEIPSARQPIAGVGTNTVGFIGIVPPEIWCPVPNPDYDPVLADNLRRFQQLTQIAEPSDEQRSTLEQQRLRLQQSIAAAEAELHQAEDDVTKAGTTRDDRGGDLDRARQPLPETASEAQRNQQPQTVRRAEARLTAAEEDFQQKTAVRDEKAAALDQLRVQSGLPAPPAPGTPRSGITAAPTDPPFPPDQEIEEQRSDPDPNAHLDVPTRFRPYHLEKFTVRAREFDTKLCTNFTEYTDLFGKFSAFKATPENPGETDPSKWEFRPRYPGHHFLTHAVDGFFRNGGTRCFVARVPNANEDTLDRVLNQFESIEELAILAAPGLPKKEEIWGQLEDYCENNAHQNVFAILDSPQLVEDNNQQLDIEALDPDHPGRRMPRRSAHAAFYFPHIEVVDPAKQLQDSDPARQVPSRYRGRTYVAPGGHVAGIFARTDEERGVHKAPANAIVRGALEVKYYISRPKQELLNPQGVNCIRLLDGDVTLWGARTVGGDRNGEWKYVSVRRFAGFLEESIKRGTQWVVFEPNDPGLWSRIILNVTAFLTILWHNGALFGLTPQEAFYVKCDEELNPPEIRDLGQVITEIGVAIVRPAEFVIFRITQSTGPRQG